jgi:hypothetical protein
VTLAAPIKIPETFVDVSQLLDKITTQRKHGFVMRTPSELRAPFQTRR